MFCNRHLERIEHLLEESVRLETESVLLEREIVFLLKRIERTINPRITGFIFTQQGEPNMPLIPIAPGFSPVITATPTPAGAVLAPGTSAVTTSSDTTNAPITTDASGLVITVNIPATAVVGTQFTLTTTYTNADGQVATSTSQPFTIVTVVTDITGFTFQQTS